MRELIEATQNPAIRGKPIERKRTGIGIAGRAIWEVPEKDPNWLFPWTGWTAVVRDEYILQAFGYEHSRGGDVSQGLAVFNSKGELLKELAGEFCEGAVFQSPDNPALASLHLLEIWQGAHAYNTLINAGQPPLSVNSYSLPILNRFNRWLVEVPPELKGRYNAEHIRYKRGRFEAKGKQILIVSEPLPKNDAGDLSFRAKFPWT